MLNERLSQEELIDKPDCRQDIICQSHKFMNFINKYFGGVSLVKDFIGYAGQRNHSNQPLQILDIGSGSCDIPVNILKWAKKQNIDIRFTCIEKDSHAMLLNRIHTLAPDLPITLINSDIFDYKPAQPFDYVIASMFLHHLDDQQIGRLISHLLGFTRKGIFINDLHRKASTYLSCLSLSPFIKKPVRHDALLSIKKGFRKNELENYFNLPKSSLSVKTHPWGRITALLELEGENFEH